MSTRSLLALGALALAFACCQFSVIAIHTIMFTALREGGETLTSVGTIALATSIWGGVGCIVGALLAYFAGPRAASIVGASILAIGALVVTLASRSMAGYSFVSLGSGALGPAGYVIAAEIFFRGTATDLANRAAPPAQRFAHAVAFVCAVQAASSIASMIAPSISSALAAGLNFSAVFALAGVVAAASLALIVASAILSAPPSSGTQASPTQAPYRAPAAQTSHEPLAPSRVGAVLALLAAGLVGTFARGTCVVSYGELRGVSISSVGLIYSLETVASLVALVPVIAVVLVRLITVRPSRTLAVLGTGFTIIALAAILHIAAIVIGDFYVFVVTAVVAGAGAAMSGPIVSGLLLGTLKPRHSALVFGGYYVANLIMSAIVRASVEYAHTPLLVLAVLLAIGGAIVSLMFSKSGFASLDA